MFLKKLRKKLLPCFQVMRLRLEDLLACPASLEGLQRSNQHLDLGGRKISDLNPC